MLEIADHTREELQAIGMDSTKRYFLIVLCRKYTRVVNQQKADLVREQMQQGKKPDAEFVKNIEFVIGDTLSDSIKKFYVVDKDGGSWRVWNTEKYLNEGTIHFKILPSGCKYEPLERNLIPLPFPKFETDISFQVREGVLEFTSSELDTFKVQIK